MSSTNTSPNYEHDRDVLPSALIERLRAMLGGYYGVITFRAGGPLTRTEERLGLALTLECRRALERHWITKRSVSVYVHGGRSGGRMTRAEAAAVRYLADRGHRASAVADVLGVATDTIARNKHYHERAEAHTRTEDARATGVAVLRKRLGRSYEFSDLDGLACLLGHAVDEVYARADLAGSALEDLRKAG